MYVYGSFFYTVFFSVLPFWFSFLNCRCSYKRSTIISGKRQKGTGFDRWDCIPSILVSYIHLQEIRNGKKRNSAMIWLYEMHNCNDHIMFFWICCYFSTFFFPYYFLFTQINKIFLTRYLICVFLFNFCILIVNTNLC